MNVSINWLNEWVKVDDLDADDLAHRLTMVGLEVDGIDRPGHGHDDIVVGNIDAIEEHPDADRLVICKVDVGDGRQRTIVCGATNMEQGDRVAVALPGSAPPGIDFDIEAREVMGVGSEGMLCSSEELGLSDDAEGLMILDADLDLGDPVFAALGMQDVVLEIDLTPNRADCLSHLGVAREIAALYDRPLREQRVEPPESISSRADGADASQTASLSVHDEEGCPHYRMAILQDIEITESPDWLKQRLQAVGVRPVNSVVDVTNYVLMDVGQPLHAFDLQQLAGPQIVVRRAEEGESLVGIDHQDYELSPEDLVIADAEKPVAIAGVMGGADSEVSEATTSILLECAWFDPTTVRRSSKRHGLHTDSSHRFERGVDAGGVGEAMRRAVDLLVQIQQEATASVPTVHNGPEVAGGAPEPTEPIVVDVQRLGGLLGIELDAQRCRQLLESIQIEVTSGEEGQLQCRIPTFRRDLRRPVDLSEEIARLVGYEEIPAELPTMIMGGEHTIADAQAEKTIPAPEQRRRIDWMRGYLLDQGLMEAINYSFMGEDQLDELRLGDDDARRGAPRVANPLVASQEMMRTTLIPSLLKNLETNFSRQRFDVALFEMGRRYFEQTEKETLALAVTGRRRVHWSGDRRWDFFDLKGLVETLGVPWATEEARWRRPDVHEPYLHPGVQAEWVVDDQVLAVVGQLHPQVGADAGFEQPVFVAELDLEAFVDAGARRGVATPAPRFPAVVRDYALVYDEDRPFARLRDAIDALAQEDDAFGAIFESMELFDVYEGEQVPEGQRSLAIQVTYRSEEKTLEEADIEQADRRLLARLRESVGAKLR